MKCLKCGCYFSGSYCHICESGPDYRKGKNGIPFETEKREKQNKEYKEKRKKFLAKNPVCQVKGCKKKALEIHHKFGRVEEDLVDESGFLGCCKAHHREIELNPEWAKKEGYSITRL